MLEDNNSLIKRTFFNNSTLEAFHEKLKTFNFKNPNLVRPDFDTYFLRLAELAATRSNCMKKGNGAIIAKDYRVVSTGYNGTPFGIKNCNEGGNIYIKNKILFRLQ